MKHTFTIYKVMNIYIIHERRERGGVSIFVHNSISVNTIYNEEWDLSNILGVHIKKIKIHMNIFGDRHDYSQAGCKQHLYPISLLY